MTLQSPQATELATAQPFGTDVAAVTLAGEDGRASAAPLALHGVSKRWHKGPQVLTGLDLTLEPGTTTWVGGQNGVGKTTMLRIAAGLIDPDEGRAEAWGLDPHKHRVRYQQLVSFLPAGDRGIYARLTVRKQLEFWGRIAMVPGERFRETIDQTIETFDLGELAERRVDRMSMGQRQRLRIAMTFMASPEIVLLDEPLTSLDAQGSELLQAAVKELLARDGAVLWCSPSGEHLDMEFDERWLLEDGRLVRA